MEKVSSALSIFAPMRGAKLSTNSSPNFPIMNIPLSSFQTFEPYSITDETRVISRNSLTFSHPSLPLLSAIPPTFDSSASGWNGVYRHFQRTRHAEYVEAARCPVPLYVNPDERALIVGGSVFHPPIHPLIHPSPIVSPPWLATSVCRALFESFKVTRWRISFQVCAV